jgi:hypothetical protein
MRKFPIILSLFLFCVFIRPEKAKAELPVKAKAILTMAGYGAGGGALLGMASMAFGNTPRAIAQGASLGLYAGLLFGTYVLVSHHNRQYGNYDDGSSPYKESTDIYGDGYESEEGGSSESSEGGGFFNRFEKLQEKFQRSNNEIPPIYLNLVHLQF